MREMMSENNDDTPNSPAPFDGPSSGSSDDQHAYVPPSWSVPEGEGVQHGEAFAGYGWRVLGYLIDALIIGVLLGIMSRVLSTGFLVDFAVGFVIRGLYAGFLIAFWNGQTVGMKVVKVVCVDTSSRGQVPLPQAMVRAFSAEIIAAASLIGLVGSLAQLLDLLWPVWDKQNQTLHDKIGRTVVLR